MFAESLDGGAVSVALIARGGSGGYASSGQAGNGHGVTLVNAVSGETSGDLHIRQQASGGGGGGEYLIDSTPAVGGQGGTAVSELTREAHSASLGLASEASGGFGGTVAPTIGSIAGTGASGVARATAINSLGSASASVVSSGGIGGHVWEGKVPDVGASGGRGGNAEGLATATSTADGQTASASSLVFGGTGGEAAGSADFLPRGGQGGDALGHALATSHGADSTITVNGEAYGGQGGLGLQIAGGGHGGDGFSRSQGIAFGDSTVVVKDRAGGGGGGALLYDPSLSEVGDGGAAHSSAQGSNVGARSVDVHASAFGAPAGYTRFVGYAKGRGGDADASAVGESSAGKVTVNAEARAGLGGDESSSGTARADALAHGVAGSITARATSQNFSGAIAQIAAASAANVDGQVHAYAEASMSAPLPAPSAVVGQQVVAYGRGAPNVGEALAALHGHANTRAQFGFADGGRVLAMGHLQASTLDGASSDGIHTYSGQVDMWLNIFAKPGVTQHILIGLLDPVLTTGFDELDFSVQLDDVTTNYVFTNLDIAIAFFSDHVLDLGLLPEDGIGSPRGSYLVNVGYSLTTHDAHAGFGFNFIAGIGPAPVPLPSALYLLTLGLGVLSWRSREVRTN